MDRQARRTRPGAPLVRAPEPIRQLRDVTRYRTEIVRERTREAQQLEKLLEDTGIKLSATVSNILGVSGRAMLEALIAGERDPRVLARAMLDRIDACTATEAKLSEHIEVMLQPFRRRIELLVTIPGVEVRAAQVILAEIGAGIGRFPSAADLASGAGVCPGNYQSGGRSGGGKTRHGDPWLKAALGQAAVSASRTKDTYLAARYRRIVARRGKKRALVALEHSILIAVRHMLTHDTEYTDLTGQYFLERTGRARQTRRLVSRLDQLGHQVTLQTEGAA